MTDQAFNREDRYSPQRQVSGRACQRHGEHLTRDAPGYVARPGSEGPTDAVFVPPVRDGMIEHAVGSHTRRQPLAHGLRGHQFRLRNCQANCGGQVARFQNCRYGR